MLDLLGMQLRPDPAHRATSKAWVAETLALSDDVTMLVTERHCTEPACPPCETVIAVL